MRFTELSGFERDVLVAVGEIEHLLRLALPPNYRRPCGVTADELRTRLFIRPGDERGIETLHQALLRLERFGFAGRVETPEALPGWIRVDRMQQTA